MPARRRRLPTPSHAPLPFDPAAPSILLSMATATSRETGPSALCRPTESPFPELRHTTLAILAILAPSIPHPLSAPATTRRTDPTRFPERVPNAAWPRGGAGRNIIGQPRVARG